MPLITSIVLPDNSQYTFQYEATPGYAGNVTGRLAQVTLPTGGSITYTYSGSYNGITCADGTPQTLTREVNPGGSGTAGTWTYTHAEGTGSNNYLWTTNITDPSGNLTAMNFQENYETERKVYQGTGTLLETVDTCYNGAAIPCTGPNPIGTITSRTVQTTLPGLSPSKTSTTYAYISGSPYSRPTDMPTEVDEYDWGPTLLRKTITAYDYNISCGVTNTNIVDHPCSVTVENASGGTVTSTTNSYNANGNLLSATSGGLTKSYTPNGNGTLATSTDVNSALTTYNYGSGSCNGAFPTSIVPPAGPTLTYTWNCNGAVMTSVTDTNGTTSYGHTDPFWRITSITDAMNFVTNITYSPTTVESSLNFASNSTVDVLSCLDGLGRPYISQRKQAQNAGTYDSIEAAYDASGRLAATSVPYSAGACVAGGSAWNTTLYDALNRPTSYTDAGGGTVSYSYSENDVLVGVGSAPSDQNSTKSHQLEYNGLGQLTSVCEITSTTGSGNCAQNSAKTGFWTKYAYNALPDPPIRGGLCTLTRGAVWARPVDRGDGN
jgi:YD repeat-containing protein